MSCSACGRDHEPSWADKKFGCADERGVRPKLGMRFRMPRAHTGATGTGHDYREDLARFPGDPQANVDGPRSLNKLIDKRKREGWTFHKDWGEVDGAARKKSKSGSELFAEAYQRAKDKGFRPDQEKPS